MKKKTGPPKMNEQFVRSVTRAGHFTPLEDLAIKDFLDKNNMKSSDFIRETVFNRLRRMGYSFDFDNNS
jgi:hypothetical protein